MFSQWTGSRSTFYSKVMNSRTQYFAINHSRRWLKMEQSRLHTFESTYRFSMMSFWRRWSCFKRECPLVKKDLSHKLSTRHICKNGWILFFILFVHSFWWWDMSYKISSYICKYTLDFENCMMGLLIWNCLGQDFSQKWNPNYMEAAIIIHVPAFCIRWSWLHSLCCC